MRRGNSHLSTEILVWAEPLVRDRLVAFWAGETRESDATRTLAELHWRMWRCALSNLPHGAAASRRELLQLADKVGVAAGAVAEGDEAVIDEIAEVIVARFRRSPGVAKDYTKALIMAAAGLLAPSAVAKAA